MATTTPWIGSALDATDRLVELSSDWDGHGALAPNCLSVVYARDFLTALVAADLKPTRIAASVVGGVGITIRKGARKAYVEFYNDGLTHVLYVGDAHAMTTRPVRPENGGYRDLATEIRQRLFA